MKPWNKVSSGDKVVLDSEFWSAPNEWPRDPPHSSFLARAFDRVGRSMFGTDWALSEDSLPEPAPPLNEDDEDAMDDYEDQIAEAERKLERIQTKVARTIWTACENGSLVGLLRPKRGGKTVPLEDHDWNADTCLTRFTYCDTSTDPYFDRNRKDCWIFIDRVSLDSFLLQQISAPLPDAPALHLSPYLKVMLQVCEKLKISPTSQPLKK